METKIKCSPNVIFIHADYVDKVAFDFIVNFERMLGRRIPKANLGQWLDCVALDGGIREGDNEIQVIFIHHEGNAALENFSPSNFAAELDGKAFKDRLGEFVLSACEVPAKMVDPDFFFLDTLATVADCADVKRLMVIAPEGELYTKTRNLLRKVDGKDITLFNMEPLPGGGVKQEILGYSLMAALGISGEELEK